MTPEEVASRMVGRHVVGGAMVVVACGEVFDTGRAVHPLEFDARLRKVIAEAVRRDREEQARPSRGTLINAAANAGAEVVMAREALTRAVASAKDGKREKLAAVEVARERLATAVANELEAVKKLREVEV